MKKLIPDKVIKEIVVNSFMDKLNYCKAKTKLGKRCRNHIYKNNYCRVHLK